MNATIPLARTKLRLPGAGPTMDGPQPPRQLTPSNCACDSPWLLLAPERVRSHPFCPRVGISLHHLSLSPSKCEAPRVDCGELWRCGLWSSEREALAPQ